MTGAIESLVKVAIKDTVYTTGGAKIIKVVNGNKNIIQSVTSLPGAQIVAPFDPAVMRFTEVDVVDRCGNLLSNVARISPAPAGACQDTGPGPKEELVCPLVLSFPGGGQALLLSDTKFTFDKTGALKSVSANVTGVGIDDSGSPLQVTAVASGSFKPAKGCSPLATGTARLVKAQHSQEAAAGALLPAGPQSEAVGHPDPVPQLQEDGRSEGSPTRAADVAAP